MDPKTATQLEELDLIKCANLQLRRQLLDKEGEAMSASLVSKYGNPGENMDVNIDSGAITRTKREEPPTP